MDKMKTLRDRLNLPQASQICIVVRDLDRAISFYENVVGWSPFVRPEIQYDQITYHGQPTDGLWEMAFASLGPIELELAHSLRGPNLYQDHLDTLGEGLHHIGFDVPEMDAVIDRAERLGIRVLMSGRTPQGGFAHLDTREVGGVIVEVIQRKVRRA